MGAVACAGAEMVQLLENSTFEIQYKTRGYHFVPEAGRAASNHKYQRFNPPN